MRFVPVIALALAVAAPRAVAHHSFQVEADDKAPIVLTGAVTAVDWVNPHVIIQMSVAGPGRAPQAWRLSAASPASMNYLGVCRATLQAGMTVTIHGWRALDHRCPVDAATGASVCTGASGYLTFANGRSAGIGYGGAPAGSSAVDPGPCRGDNAI